MGEPTSNIDWCEDNYVYNFYIAEWYNSLSNLIPIIILLNAIRLIMKHNSNTNFYINTLYISIIFVYIGSFLFHSTLTYFGQLLDEVPMIYCCIFLHYIIYKHIKHIKLYCYTLITLFTFILLYFNDNPFLSLQLPYAILNLSIIIHTINLYNHLSISYDINQYKYLLKNSAVFYGIGFICWILDQVLCKYLKEYYLHAFWHILTGIGSYYLIQFIFINDKINKKEIYDMKKTNNLYILPLYY